MQYLISFLEGIITFISPCLLPMLPIYASYFAGNGEGGYRTPLKNALAFVLGFTVVFTVLGVFAGAVGGFFIRYQTAVNIVSGLLVIFFGLVFLGVFKWKLFSGMGAHDFKARKLGFFSSFLFGLVFSISWTPCVGAFLGSALMLASQQGSVAEGVLMLLAYSLGLGIPFVLSAVLIEKLKSSFQFIKRHYKAVNMVCGILLIIIGILMMTGWLGTLLTIIS
ncbi:MAG: cytochrome c biogenesis CcdA family protein [Christensenellales bacterium]